MKKKLIFIITIVVLIIAAVAAALLLRGKEKDDIYKDFDENEQIRLERDGASEYISPVLVVYDDAKGLIGVTQLGNLVYVDNPDGIEISNGMISLAMNVTVDEEGIRHGSLAIPYSESSDTFVYSSMKNAPSAFAQARLKKLMNIPSVSGIADYRINTVTEKNVYGGENGTGIITFEVNFDVIPSRNSEIYGIPESDGWCKNLTYEFTIWGTANMWYLYGNDPIATDAFDYDDGDDGMSITYETQLYIDDRYSYRYGCFETIEESILTDVPMRTEGPDDEEGLDMDDEAAAVTFDKWYTDLYAFDIAANAIRVFEEDKQNFQYNYEDCVNGILYLTTKTWTSTANGIDSYFCCIDTKDMTFKKIVDNAIVLGKTEDTYYVLAIRMGDTSGKARSLFAIDMATSDILWESELPFPATQSNMLVCHGIYDGYAHFIYAQDKIAYMMDTATGEWSLDFTK